MTEIDNLEIRIEADSSAAAQKVIALADSLDKLGAQARSAQQPTLKAADAIASVNDAADGIKTAVSGISELSTALSAISNIKIPDSIGNLAKALQPLNTAVSTLRHFSGSAVNKSIEALNNLYGAISSVTIASERSGQIKSFITDIQSLKLDNSLANSLRSIGRAASVITNAQPNENAADSLRLFIDTVRLITDDDIQKMQLLSDAAKGLAALKLNPNGQGEPEKQIDEQQSGDLIDRLFPGIEHYGGKIIELFRWIGERGSEAFHKINTAIASVISKSGELISKLGAIGASMTGKAIGAVFAPLAKVGSAFKSATAKAVQFFNAIKRIALYRAIRSMIKSITEGFQQGRENLYQYSLLVGTQFAKSMDMAATSFLYLKNSIGAATAPLTNYLVPILDKVIDRVVELINKFNELTAVLTGADTWTRAIKYPVQWQEAADDANKAAKKLKSTMLGFDELNVIEPKQNANGNSGMTADDYLHMFEEVEVKARITGVEYEDSIFAPIVKAWDNVGEKNLNKIVTAWQNLRDLAADVRDTIREVWMGGAGQKSVEIILNSIGSISGAVGNLAAGFKKAWDNAGAGKRIVDKIWGIANNLGTTFSNIREKIENWAATVDFSPIVNSLGDLFEAIEKITDPDGTLARMFGKVWDKLFLPLATWTIEEAAPLFVETLAAGIDALSAALDNAEPEFDKFLEFLGALGDYTGENVVGILTALKVGFDIISGKDVSDEDIAALERQQQKQKDFLSGFESLGYSWFDKFNPDAASTGAWGANDSSDKYLFGGEGGYNYDAGYAAHVAEMQAEWDSPTRLTHWYDIGRSNVQFADTPWYEGRPETGFLMDFAAAWNAGLGGYFYHKDDQSEESSIDWDDALDVDGAETSISKIGGFFKDFGSNWSIGWNDMKKTVSEGWESFKTDWGSGIDTIGGEWETFKSDWSIGWDSIKKGASEKWESFKSDWLSGWETIGEKWESFKSDWSSGWETIGEKWEGFKEDWTSGWQSISESIGKTVLALWEGSDGTGGIKGSINRMLTGIEAFFRFIVNGINALIVRVNSFTIGSGAMKVISAIADKVLPESFSLGLTPISTFSLPRLAMGGVVDTGQLFIARESGAELVGRYGSNTAVMNNDQIVEAVARGVYSAVSAAMQNGNGGVNEVKVYLDGRQILARTEDIKRDKGMTLFAGAYNP